MAYSTIEELRENLPTYTEDILSDTQAEARICFSDNLISAWLSSLGVTTEMISSLPQVPKVINLISQYGACEAVLMRFYNDLQNQPAPLLMWKEKKEMLMRMIETGSLSIIASDGAILYKAQVSSIDNSYPDEMYFGYAKYGRKKP